MVERKILTSQLPDDFNTGIAYFLGRHYPDHLGYMQCFLGPLASSFFPCHYSLKTEARCF
jgi:hypothetical protein